MSTAGKVLSVLVTLMAVVWVLLAATVAQLNRNGTKAVEDLQKQVAKLEVDVKEAARNLQALKDETHLKQAQMQLDLTGLQARQSDLEKARSEFKEIGARVQYQLADAESNHKKGTAHSEERTAEKEAETKALADAQAEVEKLKGEREELVGRLNSLRDHFKAKLEENRNLAKRLQGAGAAPVRTSMAR